MTIVKSIHFKNEYRLFPADLKLEFPNSNIVVFMGANGTGKTTLLDIIEDEFKKESFFDRKDQTLKKSCKVQLGKGVDNKKTEILRIDYLEFNPHAIPDEFGDLEEAQLFIQAQSMSSGQAIQTFFGWEIGNFLADFEGEPALILLDEPETGMDVGAMTTICFILMLKVATSQKQIFISTHSSDWIRAMYLAYMTTDETVRKQIGIQFVDIVHPENSPKNFGGAMDWIEKCQTDTLTKYIAYLNDLASKRKKDESKVTKKANKKAKVPEETPVEKKSKKKAQE